VSRGAGFYLIRRTDRRRRLGLGEEPNPKRIDPERLHNVLELFLTEIVDFEVEPRLDLSVSILRETNGPGLGDAFEPRGNINTIAHEIAVALFNDVAQMNTDAEFHALVERDARVALDHGVLHFDCAAHRVDHTAKFGQRPVAGPLEHASVVHSDGGIDEIAAQSSEPR
jgi:hypothetical protein